MPEIPAARIKTITHPSQLRALAHPLRNRLLTELMAVEQASVTQLAEMVGQPINAVSYHLRQLAKYGFIEDAPELARDGRDRWWRMPYTEGLDYGELRQTAEGRVVADEMAVSGMATTIEEIRRAFPVRHDAADRRSRDWYLRMTEADVEGLDQELIELLMRWSQRTRDAVADGDTAGRSTYTFYSFLFPAGDAPSDPEVGEAEE